MLQARFHRLRNRSMAVNDKAFAEPVRLSFFTSQGTLDPTRPLIEIEAILRVGGGSTTAVGGIGSAWRVRIHAQKAELHIDRTTYPDLVIRTNDKVRALARPGQPWFEVAAIDDRTDGRLVLQLNES